MDETIQQRLLHGKALTTDLLALKEAGWTIDQLSRRLKLARGTVKRAIRHAEAGETGTQRSLLDVHPCLITGDEDKARRNAVYCTPAHVLHKIADDKPMAIDYYKIHAARAYTARRLQELASLKKAGVKPALIRLKMKTPS